MQKTASELEQIVYSWNVFQLLFSVIDRQGSVTFHYYFYQINILTDIKNMFIVCFLNRGTLQFASCYNLNITINTLPFWINLDYGS